MIKGDINNVIAWLDINGIQQSEYYQRDYESQEFTEDAVECLENPHHNCRQEISKQNTECYSYYNPAQQAYLYFLHDVNIFYLHAKITKTLSSA